MNGKSLAHQYKEYFSDFRRWQQLGHASQYLVFPQNIGSRPCIDESSLSCGELYTFVTNPEGHGGKGSLVAVVEGTKPENVIKVLEFYEAIDELRISLRCMARDLENQIMADCKKLGGGVCTVGGGTALSFVI